jgi:hypothetical protein
VEGTTASVEVREDIRGMSTVELDLFGIDKYDSIGEIGVRGVIFYKFYPS